MKLSDFDYNLPTILIAQSQIKPRDHSRLLVLNRKNGDAIHKHFYNILDYLNSGDLLILNNSKVFPARLFGKKEETGGKIEILLHREIQDGVWEAVGKNLKTGAKILFDNSKLKAKVLRRNYEEADLKFNLSGGDFFREIEKIGITPLPPYIKRKQKEINDEKNYQTVYAKNRGSVAAPTAGLHFTKDLLKKASVKGVKIGELTLHVGLGTFTPVKTENILDHKMHNEYYSVEKKLIDQIIATRKSGGRIIAVGTTTSRVLEHLSSTTYPLTSNNYSGSTDIFIYPGYKFKCVDGLITNFHLPKSTLLMLISAFSGRENIMKAYEDAIKKKYRFFSYGDAMLII